MKVPKQLSNLHKSKHSILSKQLPKMYPVQERKSDLEIHPSQLIRRSIASMLTNVSNSEECEVIWDQYSYQDVKLQRISKQNGTIESITISSLSTFNSAQDSYDHITSIFDDL
ncbi:Hypothetical_protein [Hexamita inflata]|uniref:Hypothetical_protein n=1 Tax=Hexamita inflata TaxID=28002 RepID=A0ABP1H4M5_9EUKA